MVEKSFYIWKLRNPHIVVCGEGGMGALLVDPNGNQMTDLKVSGLSPYSYGAMGNSRKVPISFYNSSSVHADNRSNFPLELSQIFACSPNFSLRESGFGGDDEESMVLLPYHKLWKMDRGFCGLDNWYDAGNFELGVRVYENEWCVFNYRCEGDDFLRIGANVRDMGDGINVFRPFVKNDETGMYIEPTQIALDERIGLAFEAASEVKGTEFERMFTGAQDHRYEKHINVASAIANRMKPRAIIPCEEVAKMFERSWNGVLQEKLYDIVRNLEVGLSEGIRHGSDVKLPFGESTSDVLEVLVGRLSEGSVSLDEKSYAILGDLLVLNNMYEQGIEQERVEKMRREVVSNQSQIEELSRKSRELSEDMNNVQIAVDCEKVHLEKNMKRRLRMMYDDPEMIGRIIDETEVLEVDRVVEEDVPF
jgi:hypothetical protein